MDSKIYTPHSLRQINTETQIPQVNNENDIKKYLSYVYQEYGDFYELNMQSDEKKEDNSVNAANSNPKFAILDRVNNFFAAEQSDSNCNCSCFCIYFIYFAVSIAVSCGLSYVAAFFIFKTKLKILLAVTTCIFMQILFLAGIPLLKKIKSNCILSTMEEKIYEI